VSEGAVTVSVIGLVFDVGRLVFGVAGGCACFGAGGVRWVWRWGFRAAFALRCGRRLTAAEKLTL
jgi:hypothetical protein